MKLIILFTLLFRIVAFGQTIQQNTGTLEDLTSMEVLTEQVVYVAGNNGTVLKTIDGGTNWNATNFPSSLNIKSISFVSSLIGYVSDYDDNGVSSVGSIYKTIDGGLNYSLVTLADNHIPFEVHFIDESTGFYVCSEGVYKTENGGLTWSQVSQDYIGLIEFPSELIGYGVNSARELVKSTDAGVNWSVLGQLSNGEFYTDITFPSIDTGFVTSSYYGAYGGTTDGGQTLLSGNLRAHSMHFPSSNIGYYLKYEGIQDSTLVGYTFDASQNWNDLLVKKGRFNRIRFANNTTGWMIGMDGVILKITFITADIKDSNVDNNLSIYPNPTSESINIDVKNSDEIESVHLITTDGKILKKWRGFQSNISIGDVPAGTYIIELISTNGNCRTKIVLE